MYTKEEATNIQNIGQSIWVSKWQSPPI